MFQVYYADKAHLLVIIIYSTLQEKGISIDDIKSDRISTDPFNEYNKILMKLIIQFIIWYSSIEIVRYLFMNDIMTEIYKLLFKFNISLKSYLLKIVRIQK